MNRSSFAFSDYSLHRFALSKFPGRLILCLLLATIFLPPALVNQADLASGSNPIRGQTTNILENVQQRVPFEGWSSSNMIQIESAGASLYNSLLVGLNKRFGHGLQLQTSYTFAKDLTTDTDTSIGPNGGISYGNQNDPASRYGPDSLYSQASLRRELYI